MLKKAGIVVAAAAAALLAVSPLAFAGEKGGYDQGSGSGRHASEKNINNAEGDTSFGLVNVSGNNVNVPIQACNNNVPIVNLIPVSDVTAALGILGNATARSEKSCGDNSGSAGDTTLQNIGD